MQIDPVRKERTASVRAGVIRAKLGTSARQLSTRAVVGLVVALVATLATFVHLRRSFDRARLNDAIVAAVESDNPQAVRRLLIDGASPNAERNWFAEDPFGWVMGQGSTGGPSVACMAAASDDAGILSMLSANGADINRPSYGGITPLMWASRCGSTHAVSVLLGNGVRTHARDLAGRSALCWARLGKSNFGRSRRMQEVFDRVIAQLRAAGAPE